MRSILPSNRKEIRYPVNKPRSTIEIRCHRANSWITRARDLPVSDLDGKFIFYWIAVNALYGQPKYLERSENRTNDLADLQTFLNSVIPRDVQGRISNALKSVEDEIVQLLRERYLCKSCWIHWQNRGLLTRLEREQDSCRHRDTGTNLNRVFSRLYVLRNQLFHGCSSERGSKNRDMLKRAVKVLETFAPALQELAKETGKSLQILKTISYPPTT